MSKNAAGNYRVGGQSYSESELEEIAERIEKSPYSQLTIDKYFLGEAKTEEELRKRLVITHYFLAKDRHLTKEMRGLLASGINEFLGGGKSTWKRPQVKAGNDLDSLILMLAIHETHPGIEHQIADAIGRRESAVDARLKNARKLCRRDDLGARELLSMLKYGLLKLNIADALELLIEPSKGEQFIKETVSALYK